MVKSKLPRHEDVNLEKIHFEDSYAQVSFLEAVPCVRAKFNGVPFSSDHYQYVQSRILDSIKLESENYCRLHLMTDNSKAGIILQEDVAFYQDVIIPSIEKIGVRYHAIILPESTFVRWVNAQVSISTKKIHVEYFNTFSGASKWLRHR